MAKVGTALGVRKIATKPGGRGGSQYAPPLPPGFCVVNFCAIVYVALGYRDGSYDPTGPVLHAQAVSFVTRAMIRKGYWTLQEDNAAYYTAVPMSSGHRQDAVTYRFYAGNILGTAAPTDPWNGPTGFDQPSTRTYFAQVLWQAYSSYFSVNHIP